MTFRSVGIVGAGAWGTALAQTLRLAGRETVIWAREPEVVEDIIFATQLGFPRAYNWTRRSRHELFGCCAADVVPCGNGQALHAVGAAWPPRQHASRGDLRQCMSSNGGCGETF